ncbi:Shiga toxin A subunit (plasmid) [Nissabacter sp. SGAir0207]|nr:Shiga toxin A subunit [Nissabacter sp. SGAir0207]
MEIALFQNFTEKLNIDPSSIEKKKTEVSVLDISPVSAVFASQTAANDHAADAARHDGLALSEAQYLSSYLDDGVKNVTAKYTYYNQRGQKDVFIASGLINANECSVRFNGYLTLAREF